jgi:L-fuconolactonase
VWDASRRDHAWLSAVPTLEKRYDVADYEKEAQRLGIQGAILIQVLNDVEETKEFLEIARGSTLVRGVVGWVDLAARDVDDQLAELQDSSGGDLLVGVRHLLEGEADPRFLERPEIVRGLHAVARRGLVFDFMGRADQLASARRVLERCDDLRMVLDRAGKPDLSDLSAYGWDENLRAMATTQRVAAKFAGMANEAGANWSPGTLQPTVDFVIDVLGPSSVMFGSDWPVCLAVATLDEVVELSRDVFSGLTLSEWNTVFEENARRVYRLTAA